MKRFIKEFFEEEEIEESEELLDSDLLVFISCTGIILLSLLTFYI